MKSLCCEKGLGNVKMRGFIYCLSFPPQNQLLPLLPPPPPNSSTSASTSSSSSQQSHVRGLGNLGGLTNALYPRMEDEGVGVELSSAISDMKEQLILNCPSLLPCFHQVCISANISNDILIPSSSYSSSHLISNNDIIFN